MFSPRRLPSRSFLLLVLLPLSMVLGTGSAHADAYSDVVDGLNASGAYLTPHPPPGSHIRPGDIQRLRDQVTTATNLGVDEDIAVVSSYPPNFHSPQEAASSLLNFLDFDGVLILVSPQGIALSSDQLSDGEDSAIARQAAPICATRGWTECAILAAKLAVTKDRADKNSAFHDAIVFWAIFFIALAILVVLAIIALRLRRRGRKSPTSELRRAAEATMAELDSALRAGGASGPTPVSPGTEQEEMGTEIPAGAGKTPNELDRVLQLRTQARKALEDRSGGERELVRANEDAAAAMLLALAALPERETNPRPEVAKTPTDLTPLANRCLYCAREDRPPFVSRSVEDGRGHALAIEICSVCQAQLQRGQTPPVTSSASGGDPVPWWAVPGNPWRATYGGASWQYWLPFLIGMDVADWFRGGWQSSAPDRASAARAGQSASQRP